MCNPKYITKMKTSKILPFLITPLVSYNAVAKVTPEIEKDKPNFIVIFCDDLGYGDLSCFGHPTIKTPSLDKMASEGQKWTNFYVSASVSSPSRAGLLTGRLGVRTGMYGDNKVVLYPNSPQGLPESELTIASLLKQSGYATACVGKWHLGHKEPYLPLNHGFDYFYGIPFSNDMSRKEQKLKGNPNYKFELPFYNQLQIIETEPDQTQLTKRLTEYAVSFIEQHTEDPFFLYLAHPMPHIPLYSSSSFEGKSVRGKYGDAVEEIDWSVAQIMESLVKNGLDKNTIVVFTSDNGPWLIYEQEGGSAGLLKDGKGSSFEGGFRVPCIIWGDMVQPSLIVGMGSTLDILPTFCDMAGIELPEDRMYDGYSLKQTLFEKEESPREVFYFYKGSKLHAIKSNQYKMHFSSAIAYPRKKIVNHAIPLLYDTNEDPGENFDLSDQLPEVIQKLTSLAEKFESSFRYKESIFDLPVEK